MKLEQPLNANERFLYAIAVRLEVLIDQVSAITEHIAARDGVATENNITSEKVVEAKVEREVVEEKPKRTARKKKVE